MSSSTAQVQKPKPTVEEEEEDLDDLDDVLTQFKVPPKPVPSTTASTSKAQDAILGDPVLPPELEADLAKGMEDLFKNLSLPPDPTSSLGGGSSSAPVTEDEKKFREIWEKMLVDGMEGRGEEDPEVAREFEEMMRKVMIDSTEKAGKEKEKDASGSKVPGAGVGADNEFQDAIRQAMDRMKASDETLKNDPQSNDQYAQMLSQLGNMDPNDMPEGMEGMLEDMLGALMSKEVLYEPLKEINDQFPKYFEEHPNIPPADKERFEKQYKISGQILAIFNRPGYKDDDPEVLRLMNEMQTLGQPPPEIMGPLPDGMGMDGLMNGGEGCVVS